MCFREARDLSKFSDFYRNNSGFGFSSIYEPKENNANGMQNAQHFTWHFFLTKKIDLAWESPQRSVLRNSCFNKSAFTKILFSGVTRELLPKCTTLDCYLWSSNVDHSHNYFMGHADHKIETNRSEMWRLVWKARVHKHTSHLSVPCDRTASNGS